MDRIKRNGAAGLALRVVVLGVCLLASGMRSTAPFATVDAGHAGCLSAGC
jgi:hypothetical protein